MPRRRRRRRKRHIQQAFAFAAPDPRRGRAGRRPKIKGKPGVSHKPRPPLDAQHPVHVTLRLRDDAPNLRRDRLLLLLTDVLRSSCQRDGFRLCHYTIMGYHVHLIVEADDKTRLARGIQGLSIRLARRVNGATERRGRFFSDRYHARILRSPTDVHHAIAYVLHNHRKHAAERGVRRPPGLDAFSSSPWFEGFESPAASAARLRRLQGTRPVAAPGRWLLREGWRRAGPIRP